MTPEKTRAAFSAQSIACANLGSPFMGQLMRLFAEKRWPTCSVTDRIFNWDGDITPAAQSVPLRLAGALHALHLLGHDLLAAVYPPVQADDATLWEAVAATLKQETTHLHTWLDSAPQTNEVRRSAAMIATGHLLADRFGLPMRSSELGASGGLNLHWDAYALVIGDEKRGATAPALTLRPDWTGSLPPAAQPNVIARAGVDLNPLDPRKSEDALRLQAYLWPDQPQRLSLTRAAITAAQTTVTQGDAIDWLGTRMAHQSGVIHLIYSTVAWQYFPASKQKEGTSLIEHAGSTATQDTPLAWFGMENDGDGKGAALTLRLWPGDIRIDLGRADFHGRWINWNGIA